MREMYLSPGDSNELGRVYEVAAKDSVELLVATAFLTEWPIKSKLWVGCKSILILVGTDFGLTRKKALRQLLGWIPKEKKYNVLAVPPFMGGSFHPKIIAWKDKAGKYFALFGSSNLTIAAFDRNHEANILQQISTKEFQKIKSWLRNISAKSEVVSADWIKKYREASRIKGRRTSVRTANNTNNVIDLRIRVLKEHLVLVKSRRKQQESFEEIRKPLLDIIRNCAAGKIRSKTFWEEFWKLWGNHSSRFQGSGIQWFGKGTNWKQACSSMQKIIQGPNDIFDLDLIVQSEIDFLAKKKNQARGAWLTEMCCHFYPNSYPILNRPVKDWLKVKGYRAQSGASEGSKYIELSIKMRSTRDQSPKISTLAELDIVIWRIMDALKP